MPETIQNNTGRKAENDPFLSSKNLDSDQITELKEILNTIIDVERERSKTKLYKGLFIFVVFILILSYGLVYIALLTT